MSAVQSVGAAGWEDDTPVAETPAALLEKRFPDLVAFVEWLTVTYARDQGSWCPDWNEHPEAVSRLGALWDAFEELRGKPLGIAQWWLQFADPMMAALRSPDGPFGMCGRDHWEADHG